MGRWAQASRRGGRGPQPLSTAPVLLRVNNPGGSVVILIFDRALDAVSLPPPGTFTVAGQDMLNLRLQDPSAPYAVFLDVNGPVSVGDAWDLEDGSWASPAPGAPQAGLVT